MKKILLSVFILILAVSCGSKVIHKSTLSASTTVTAEGAKLSTNISVGEKISGSATSKTLFGFISLESPEGYADGIKGMRGLKGAAAYDALIKSGADIIVNPQYTYVVDGGFFGKTKKCTVTGFKGTVDGFDVIE